MVIGEQIHFCYLDADSIRALACKALVGLAKSPAAQQIMSKLPIFTNNELQQLVREPVLQDKRGLFTNYQLISTDCLQNSICCLHFQRNMLNFNNMLWN